MKKQLAFLAALAALSTGIQAQNVYGGMGLPGLVTIGYAHPMAADWGLRGEYAGGFSVSKEGVQDGVNATISIKANRVGAFADWFPFSGGFRLVGGLTANDIQFQMNAIGSGTATIGTKTVAMVNETFNVTVKYPTATPYIGIGYGHRASKVKGLGFYADLGVMIGSFTADVNTSLLNKTIGSVTITQADIDAQKQTMRDSLGKLSVLPSVSIGVTYRF